MRYKHLSSREISWSPLAITVQALLVGTFLGVMVSRRVDSFLGPIIFGIVMGVAWFVIFTLARNVLEKQNTNDDRDFVNRNVIRVYVSLGIIVVVIAVVIIAVTVGETEIAIALGVISAILMILWAAILFLKKDRQ